MSREPILVAALVALGLCSARMSHAQLTTIDVPPEPAPSQIHSNTQLNVFEGGALPQAFLAGVPNAASENVEVNVFAGSIGGGFRAYAGAVVNVHDGDIGAAFNAYDGSHVNIFGGRIQHHFRARNGSSVQVSGGSFDDQFRAESGSQVILQGDDFRLDGVLLPGLNNIGDVAAVDLPEGSVLSGTLSDGSPIALGDGRYPDIFASDTLRLERVTLPPVERSLIRASTDPIPYGIRDGQTIEIGDGDVVGDNFVAGWGSVVNMSGGEVGDNFEAVGAIVNISEGNFGPQFDAMAGSVVNISGGYAGWNFDAMRGSIVNLTGGRIGAHSRAWSGSVLRISEGSLAFGFKALEGSSVTISGGAIGKSFEAMSGSELRLLGGEFRLDGELIDALTEIGATLAIDIPVGSSVSGTLADGTPFAFVNQFVDRHQAYPDYLAPGVLTLEATSLPAVESGLINAATDSVPASIRQGQTVIVGPDAAVQNELIAGIGSAVVVEGGETAAVEAIGANVSVSSGTVGRYSRAFAGSVLNITGGRVNHFLQAHGSEVNLSGGILEGNVEILNGSRLTISGGALGSSFRAFEGSRVTLLGSDFRLDGEPVGGLNSIGDQVPVDLPRGSVLTCTLADGTPFAFVHPRDDELASGVLWLEEAAVAPPGPDLILASTDPVPLGVRAGQTVVVDPDGVLSNHFNAGRGSIVRVTGGRVGSNLEAAGATVEIEAGTVGSLDALVGSTVRISGGSIGSVRASDSTVLMSGGSIGNYSSASHIRLSGGRVGTRFVSSDVELVGGEFRLDGQPLGGLENSGDVLDFEWGNGQVLSGVFADGSPFAFSQATDILHSNVRLQAGEVAPMVHKRILASFDSIPLGIREGQTMVVDDGSTVADNFIAGWGSKLEVTGGDVGNYVEAVGSTVEIWAGTVGDHFDAFHGSVVRLHDGAIGNYFDAYEGSSVEILGGSVGFSLTAHGGSEVTISGGTITSITAYPDSHIAIYGSGFAVNDVPVEFSVPGQPEPINTQLSMLTGLLADGTPISLRLSGSFWRDALLTVTEVAARVNGDYDGNGLVDQGDLDLVLLHWGESIDELPSEWIHQRPTAGVVDQAELDAVLVNWGASRLGNTIAIPEPQAAALLIAHLLCATVCMLVKRGGRRSTHKQRT